MSGMSKRESSLDEDGMGGFHEIFTPELYVLIVLQIVHLSLLTI